MLIVLFLVSHFNFLFVPCGGLSWLPVSFLLHVKYTLSYRIVYCDDFRDIYGVCAIFAPIGIFYGYLCFFTLFGLFWDYLHSSAVLTKVYCFHNDTHAGCTWQQPTHEGPIYQSSILLYNGFLFREFMCAVNS